MPYSPEDIVAYEFRLKARGYDRDEVDRFLDALADQVEQAAAAQDSLRAELADVKAQLAESRDSEIAFKRTLITVQDASDRALAEAKEEVAQLRDQVARELTELRRRTAEEAQETLARAEAEARGIVDAAEQAATQQRERIGALQQIDAEHRRWLREHLDTQLEALHELPDPFAPLAEELAESAPTAPAESGDPEPLILSEEVSEAPATAAAEADDDHDPWQLLEAVDAAEASSQEPDVEPDVEPDREPDVEPDREPDVEPDGEEEGSSEAEDEKQREGSDPPMWS